MCPRWIPSKALNAVVSGVAAFVIVELANFIHHSPAQPSLQLISLARLGAVVIQREGFDIRCKVERVDGRVR